MIEYLLSQLQNQFVGGGLVLMAAGTALALARGVPRALFEAGRRRFVVQVEVTSDTPLYWHLARWMNQLPYVQRSRRLSALEDRDELVFMPAPGTHLFFFEGRLIWLHREREKQGENNTVVSSGKKHETVTLRTFGNDPTVLRHLLQAIYEGVQEERKGKIGIFSPNSYGDWLRINTVEPRSIESVVLPEGHREQVMADMRAFLDARARYTELGVPWRRGYLFYGPPGTGKSSLVKALASHLALPLYLLPMASKSVKDEDLAALMADVPAGAVLLLEDVDCVSANREDDDADVKQAMRTGVTMSGLLNAIDGVGASEGRILVMTTNYLERLDAALVRAGRIDVRLAFDFCDLAQADQMFERFFPAASAEERADFLGWFCAQGGTATTADVQGELLKRDGWWNGTIEGEGRRGDHSGDSARHHVRSSRDAA